MNSVKDYVPSLYGFKIYKMKGSKYYQAETKKEGN